MMSTDLQSPHMAAGRSMFEICEAALAALGEEVHEAIGSCDNAQEAWIVVSQAPLDIKPDVFCEQLNEWADRLSRLVSPAFQDFVEIGTRHPAVGTGDAIHWAEMKLREVFETRIGHYLPPSSSSPEPGDDLDSWFTAG